MRKIFLLLVALSLSLAVNANDKLTAPTKVFLMQQVEAAKQSAESNSNYVSLKTVNGVDYVDCFVTLVGTSFSDLEKLGAKVTGKFSDFVIASIPVNRIEDVARLKSVKQVGVARNKRLLTDVAKTITNADKAWDGTNYGLPQGFTGQGVVVGLIDVGIQFNHRAFLNEDGTTRVKAVYMPNASNANGGTRATIDGVELMGYQYTTPEQIAALTCDYSSESHGTHTTGCASGSHVGNYAGMAPEADLILCGTGTSSGYGLTESALLSSAKYIGWYAQQLGKPCVISISIGSDTGPHDGMSSICLGYQEVAEQYGAVILLAAGNEADITGAAEKTLASDDDYMAVTHIRSSWTSYNGECDIWNSTSDELQVKVIVSGSQSGWMTNGTFSDVTVQGGVNANNNRYNLNISSGASSATYVIKGKGGNVIHVYTDCSYSELSSQSGTVSGYTITPGTYEGSMCDDMTSPKVISVGAQASRSSDGYGQGDVAYFSSYGVDCNGVNQPLITAPGHYVISSVNGYDTYQSYTWSTTFNGNTYKWGQMSGTSMATPCAAGVVALYLQADPSLDVDRVKEVIAATATQYPSSSTSPVLSRGYGIINALDGIQYILEHQGPFISVNPTELNFNGYAGETYTQTVKVKGYNLTENISIAKSGSNLYSVTPTTITPEDASNGVDVTITYAPTAAGSTEATLTLTSDGAEEKTVAITGEAQPRVPTILTDPESLNFVAKLSTPMTKTVNVTGLFLTNDITVTLNDENGVFTVSPTTISKNSTGVDTPVEVSVTFSSDEEGDYTGSLILTSNGAETKTVQLTANASDFGLASDQFLNIARYATIDDAGATVSGMDRIYKYTIVDDAGWLTLSNYGAMQADNTQNWYETSSLSQYTNTWAATDIFLGDDAYFGSNNSYSIYGSGNQTFYVTNCVQAKAYVKGGSSSNATLAVYECTLNADGTLVAATTATDSKQGSDGVITSASLDPSKIYKVQLTGGGSYPDLLEIGFKMELDIPMIVADPSDLTIATAPGETGTATINVRGKMLPGDVTVALNDPNNVFTVSANTISQADAEAGTQLTVTFESDEEANCQGTITLTSGTLTKTVNLTGRCNDGGTASDAYLNIAKYATIDDAGATVSYMTSIYNYAETDDYGWLTVSTYGAKKADATQNWLETGSLSDYNNSWTATDIFPVDDAFFGTSQAYGIYGSGSQTFYVTNCTQAKALVKDGSSSKATLAIYECTLNASGQPVAAATAFDSQQGGASGLAVITSAELDASKIYKVQLTGGGSYPDLLAVGFQTPLEQPVEGTPLAEILSDGVDGQEYIVSDDLAVVDFADNDNYAFLTDGVGNWITVYAEDDIFAEIKALAVIAGGSLKGTLSDVSLNPVIYIAEIPTGSTSSVNYVIEAINLANPFTLVSDQVVDVTGYWNAADGALRAYSEAPQGQSLTIDHSWGAAENTMQDGLRYTVRCAINFKEAWKTTAGIAPKDYEYDFQNYIGYALRIPSTSTAINTIGVDANKIVNVYNLQGMLLKQNIKAGDALKELTPGIYLIGGKKVIVK